MLYSKRSSRLLNWWWSIDSVAFIVVLSIILIGLFLNATASPVVAERIGMPYFHFLSRQAIFLCLSVFIIIAFTLLEKRHIKIIGLIGFVIIFILMVLVLFIGDETKGAKRWISLVGFSLQPSELLKPFYMLLIALILSMKTKVQQNYWGNVYTCLAIHIVVTSLLLLQPDFGMTITISLVTATQIFVSGLPIIWLIISAILLLIVSFSAYHTLPHVAKRIESFLDSENHANYQVQKSLESFVRGGFLGTGPAEGSVKMALPDSHTDFIFAVAGEEMGSVFCIVIISLFIAFLVRGLSKLSESNDMFDIYAIIGILMYFGIQSVVNIGVSLHLFPTKGMTLPFISYGGSSVISFAILTGIYLALTKKTHNSIRYHGYIK
jgi:cell division protein FtsW